MLFFFFKYIGGEQHKLENLRFQFRVTWAQGWNTGQHLPPGTFSPIPLVNYMPRTVLTEETSSQSAFFSCSKLHLQAGCQPLFHTCLQQRGSGWRQRCRNIRLGLAQRLTRPPRCVLAPRLTGHHCAALWLSALHLGWKQTTTAAFQKTKAVQIEQFFNF